MTASTASRLRLRSRLRTYVTLVVATAGVLALGLLVPYLVGEPTPAAPPIPGVDVTVPDTVAPTGGDRPPAPSTTLPPFGGGDEDGRGTTPTTLPPFGSGDNP